MFIKYFNEKKKDLKFSSQDVAVKNSSRTSIEKWIVL